MASRDAVVRLEEQMMTMEKVVDSVVSILKNIFESASPRGRTSVATWVVWWLPSNMKWNHGVY